MTPGPTVMREPQWSEALAGNNVRAIIRWLRKLTAEGDADVEETLATFSCWTQRTSEFAKKELLTLCFSRCQGLWMFLDHGSFARVHVLLQRLRNLLTLAQWARRQLSSEHLWHGLGVPCVMCRDVSSEVRRSCWAREHRNLREHIWLGQLVQWWGIMGLLPKCPEAHEVKRISQMWKEMDHSHRKARPETPGGRREEGRAESRRSFIQAMVAQLDKRHGSIWTCEAHGEQGYPPPNLQALLKLVLVPRIDYVSVQTILMYFILDMTNFLQCKDDLLQSFCHAFTVPSSFSQQIRAFWMLDHGHVKASMELLLSPRAAAPRLSWQHRCVLCCLLERKQPQLALRYLHWTRPAMESIEDVKLCADVLLRNSCVSGAWDLLRRGQTESDDMILYFLQACEGMGRSAEALKYVPAGYNGEEESDHTAGTQLPLTEKDGSAGRQPRPLSAKLHQAQTANPVSPGELVQLLQRAAMEVRTLSPGMSTVVWPELEERKPTGGDMSLCAHALRHLTPSPAPPADRGEEEEEEAEEEESHPVETMVCSSSSGSPLIEDLSSASSFTSASSLPLLRRDRSYIYESTLTLQRISSLLTDGREEGEDEDEDEEEGEEAVSKSPSPAALRCPELTVTLDGAIDPVSLFDLNKDILVGLMLSGRGGEEGSSTDALRDVAAASRALMDDSSNSEDRRTSLNVTTIGSLSQDNQPEPGIFSFSGRRTSKCYLQAHESCLSEEAAAGISIGPSRPTPLTPNATQHPSNESHGGPSEDPRSKTDESRIPDAVQQAAAATKSDARPSLLLSCPLSPISFTDFTMQREGKQLDEEGPAGWKGSPGAMRSTRERLRKGKRVKRA